MKHPSGDGDAVYQILIKIAVRVLVFIKYYRALGLMRGVLHHVACWIIPHLQVASLALLEGLIYRWIRCERSGQNQ